MPAPYWTTYPEAIALAGGVPVVIDTDEATGFRVTVDQLEAARTAAHQGAAVRVARTTRPARCTRPSEVEAIGRWAVEHGIWVVTDEIYEHLTYGDHELHLDAGARARAGRAVRDRSTAWPRPTP